MTGEARTSWPADTLRAIRNPMVFNAFAITIVAALAYFGTDGNLTTIGAVSLGTGVLFAASVTTWLNWFASRNPRFLAYGPEEYLRESQLEHQRRMKVVVPFEGDDVRRMTTGR